MLQFPRKINPLLLPDDDADVVLLEEPCQGLWSCLAPGSAVPTMAPGCSSPSPQAAPPAPIATRPHPQGRMHPTHRSMMLLLNWRLHVTDFICSSSSCILPDTQRGTYTGAARRPLPAGETEAVAEQQGCPKPRSLSWDDTAQPQPHASPTEPEPEPWCCPTEDEQQAVALSPRHQAVHEPLPNTHWKAISRRAWLRGTGEGTGGTRAGLRFSVKAIWGKVSNACRDGDIWQLRHPVSCGLTRGCCVRAASPWAPCLAEGPEGDQTLGEMTCVWSHPAHHLVRRSRMT